MLNILDLDDNSRNLIGTCILCDFTYTSPQVYKQHQRSEHGFKPNHFPCNKCSYVAIRFVIFQNHVNRNHNTEYESELSSEQVCLLCDFTYRNLKVYQKHKFSAHGFKTRNYPCNKCNFVGLRIQSLQNHVDTVHGGKTYSCDLCGFIVDRYTKLELHIRNFHEGTIHQCDQCGNTYSNEANLRKHRNAIHEGVKYTCTECDFSCTRPEMLKAHKDKIHAGILYQCDECTFFSTAKVVLKNHKESKHLGIRFYCDKCVFEATTKQGLNKHLLVKHHIGTMTKVKVESARHNCDLCSSTFQKNGTLLAIEGNILTRNCFLVINVIKCLP